MGADEEQSRPVRRKGHPILIRVPQDMLAQLRELARRRAVPVATVARQVIKERLDELAREETT